MLFLPARPIISQAWLYPRYSDHKTSQHTCWNVWMINLCLKNTFWKKNFGNNVIASYFSQRISHDTDLLGF